MFLKRKKACKSEVYSPQIEALRNLSKAAKSFLVYNSKTKSSEPAWWSDKSNPLTKELENLKTYSSKQANEISALKSEVAALKKDNEQLRLKIDFLNLWSSSDDDDEDYYE